VTSGGHKFYVFITELLKGDEVLKIRYSFQSSKTLTFRCWTYAIMNFFFLSSIFVKIRCSEFAKKMSEQVIIVAEEDSLDFYIIKIFRQNKHMGYVFCFSRSIFLFFASFPYSFTLPPCQRSNRLVDDSNHIN